VHVLLAVPPGVEKLEIYKVTGIRAPPLGLAYIAAVLERAGHAVKIIDNPTLGLDKSSFLSEIKTWNPDVVGFTSLTPTAYKAYEAVKMINEYDKDLPVIMGGPHATFMYEEALSNGVDVVVRGEGEITTLELVNVISRHGLNTEALRGVLGLAFKEGGRVVVTPDKPLIQNLDTLPPPARHLLVMSTKSIKNRAPRGHCTFIPLYLDNAWYIMLLSSTHPPCKHSTSLEALFSSRRINGFPNISLVEARRAETPPLSGKTTTLIKTCSY
jgi:magnesium-protoporphyrin IX monomethyl ester (oxidative) cyclase